jgi:parvulin-like peptidyl-prolyl isomerase
MMADLQTNGLKQLIEDKLILSRANAIGIEVRGKLVDQRVAEIKAKYASEQVFLEALVKNGATITDLRDKILDQLKIKFVIDHEVRSKVFVNPQEVTEFYEQNKDSFQKSRRVNLDSIYITFIEDKEAARARAKEVIALLKEGKDFETLAKQYSDSSSIGIVEQGQFLPDVEKVVFSLTQDQISDPVETDNGIFIFKLKGEIPAQVAELKEVKSQIYDLLYRKKFQERFEQWLGKLQQKAYVEIKE